MVACDVALLWDAQVGCRACVDSGRYPQATCIVNVNDPLNTTPLGIQDFKRTLDPRNPIKAPEFPKSPNSYPKPYPGGGVEGASTCGRARVFQAPQARL